MPGWALNDPQEYQYASVCNFRKKWWIYMLWHFHLGAHIYTHSLLHTVLNLTPDPFCCSFKLLISSSHSAWVKIKCTHTYGKWSKSSVLARGRTVTLFTSLCRPSSRKRRNSWASCWLENTKSLSLSIGWVTELRKETKKSIHLGTTVHDWTYL